MDSIVKAVSMVYSTRNKGFGVLNTRAAHLTKRVGGDIEKNCKKNDGFENLATELMGYKYEFGDMVWGKVKSYPWWPGQVFNEAFAASCVHKTKRQGHVLVAFFGDSSYGWLDPMDLVPFDSYYAEMSKQTNARAFVNAVEEAEYEFSRRAALGLLCRCRSPSKFRPTCVQGFLKVDVSGYQPGGLYTAKQIKSARAGFQSVEMLDFLKQLASMSTMNFQRSVHWIKNKATVLAYRKAIFKEYDETYTEAFGAQPLFPVDSKMVLAQQDKMPSQVEDSGAQPAFFVNSKKVLARQVKVSSRASLSGPLKIVTSPEVSKISAMATIVKDQHNIDKDLYKRKDELDFSRVHHVSQGHQNFSTPSLDEASLASGNLVLQTRDASVPKKTEFPCQEERNYTFGCVDVAPSSCLPSKEATTMDKKPSLEQIGSVNVTVDWEINCIELVGKSQGFQQAQPIVSKGAKNYHGLDNMQVVGRTMAPLDASSDIVGQKPRVLKRFGNELTNEKKIKKIKKEFKLETGVEHLHTCHKILISKTLPRESAGKSYQTVLDHKEYSLMDQQRKGNGGNFTISSDSVAGSESVCPRSMNTAIAQLLKYLLALAFSPLCRLEHNTYAMVLQFFLQFRSCVCQKNPDLCTPAEVGTKYLAFSGPAKSSYDESAQDLPSASKPPQKRLKPNNYGKVIWDSSIVGSEAMSIEGLENVNELESVSVERKVGNDKALKLQGRVRKETDLEVPLKPIKSSLKKVETPKKVAKPTMLVMKFPRQSTLPSVSELKAKFACFGSFVHSPRVFWKSSTCRILFKFESDAQVARRYAVQNRSLFGDAKVHYDVQALQVPASMFPKSSKQFQEEAFSKLPLLTHVSNDCSTGPSSKVPWQQQLPRIHPKSSLKKQLGDKPQSMGGPTGNQHVKFMLIGDGSNEGEQLVVNNIIQKANANHPSGISSSSHATIDDNGKNLMKATLPLPPWLPLSYWIPNVLENHEVYQFVEACNMKYLQDEKRNKHIYPNNQHVDVSSAFLNLLMQCNAIVADVKSSLGYVPYHL